MTFTKPTCRLPGNKCYFIFLPVLSASAQDTRLSTGIHQQQIAFLQPAPHSIAAMTAVTAAGMQAQATVGVTSGPHYGRIASECSLFLCPTHMMNLITGVQPIALTMKPGLATSIQQQFIGQTSSTVQCLKYFGKGINLWPSTPDLNSPLHQ